MIITLIGYRGCGKSSVAPLLAEALGWAHVDSDAVVEDAAGCSVREIFEAEGEAGFRQRETLALQTLLQGQQLIVAAGGGAVLAEENRQRMRKAGPVVWLDAANETLAARIAGDITTAQRRPSLTGSSVTEEVAAVMTVRRPIYQSAATIVICVDDVSPQQVATRILDQLNLTDMRETDMRETDE